MKKSVILLEPFLPLSKASSPFMPPLRTFALIVLGILTVHANLHQVTLHRCGR